MGKAISYVFVACAIAATLLLFSAVAGATNLGEHLASYIEALGVVGGAVVACAGLQTWRSEMVGGRRADLAEQALELFYRARDELLWIRSPAAFGGEGESRPHEPDEDEQIAHDRNSFYVPIARIRQSAEFWAQLQALRYRFAARFGRATIEPFIQMHGIVVEIQTASASLIRIAGEDRFYEQQRFIDMREAWEAVIWAAVPDEDTILRRIDDAVARIEAICRPAIEGRSRLPQ